MPFQFPGSQLALVTTGNVRTTWDPVVASVAANAGWQLGDPRSYQLQAAGMGLKCPLGTVIMDQGNLPDNVSGTAAQLPLGQVVLYKYVLYKSAANPAMVASPGVVYYTDNTGTVVSGAIADGFIHATTAASLSDVAGYMMINTTDLTTITATLLNNGTLGSGVWIAISGFVKAATSITSTVAGDYLYGGGTPFTPGRIAAHTAGGAFVDRTLAQALTSLSGSTSDVNVLVAPGASY